ncbi:MAG: VOC family protein, partial [Gemmatimonadota bacterium]|nr:VOC family protein [Gemmatimonadota bacterium]
MSLNIYLHFNGNCREVFDYYRSIFGEEYAIFQTFRDMPTDDSIPDEMRMSEEELDQVMHVSYPIGSSVLMGSDVPRQFAPPVTQGNNFSISHAPGSREEA